MTEILKRNVSTGAEDTEVSSAPADAYQTGVISTARFCLGPAVHARQAIIRKAARFWMAAALPLGALVVGGMVYDIRLLFVGAVLMFVLFPALLFFGWYGILTRPWAVASLFPHEVVLASDNEVTVEYHPMEGRESAPPEDLVIPCGSVTGCQFVGRNLIVCYGGGRELIIPLSAFSEPAAALAFQRRLEEGVESVNRFNDDF